MKNAFLVSLLFLSSPVLLAEKKLSFMPENELSEEDNLNSLSQVTEKDFNELIDQVKEFYEPIVKSHGARLQVVKHWKDPTVNAYAIQYGDLWQVSFFGGLARRKEITKDGFQLVVCHEMGHHLGGYPYVEWASNEGQSDYYSTLSCARQLWKKDIKKNEEVSKGIPHFPKKLCQIAWPKKDDKFLCYRIMLASKSLSDLLGSSIPKYETPDKTVVTKTDDEHPAPQCRLDTYMAGSLCQAKFDPYTIPKTQGESKSFTCFESEGQKWFRPKCWFKELGDDLGFKS